MTDQPVTPAPAVTPTAPSPAAAAPTPVVNFGVTEIQNLLAFAFALAGQVEKVVAKGSVSLFDLPGFYGAFQAAGPLLANIKLLLPQIENLNDSEITQIRTYVSQNLGQAVSSDAIDQVVLNALALVQQLYDFVLQVKNPAAASSGS